MKENIKLVNKEKETEIPYELLLLADPSLELIKKYLKEGRLYQVELKNEIVGVLLLWEISSSVLEIKNIAVAQTHQGKGLGKQLLRFAEEKALQEEYSILRIATGNSSIAQLALYQKMGFEIVDMQRDFFLENYPEAIWENEIQCKHLLILEKGLRS